MYTILVKIFVSLFVPKSKRLNVKMFLLSFWVQLSVRKRARHVGKNFACSYFFPVRVNKNTTIGDNVVINGLIVYGDGDVNIGSYIHMGGECVICSDNHNYEGNAIPFDETVIRKTVQIGDFSWLGARTIILPGTTIGEGAIIQAGSVVHGEIPPYSIAGGNPAKVFKMRDVEHFKKLKEEKKFFV